MARRLTVAEQLASEEKDILLDRISEQSGWSQFLVMQAVLVYGAEHDTFSCNQLRDVLPELGHGFLGAAINALRQGGILQHTGQYVPSTSPATHGHPIALWRLSVKGLLIAEQRRTRTQQRPAA
ncbi:MULTISPECIES: hypothetical protein [Streptomyces]|uniref:Uncharacterized protein n=1 Tax=Streptomyces venezuelae (strain ATCC 10712 / CBS 650.69 / DSM 40230 / JCM 4526 / NBRC 13096 / PD 04745) TaxID=953739 RepID=F2RKY3_STRVP|nr:hypothetical protein [Streptomyces venezuelae]APE21353.1 hypothetical protein vnz_10200 [Streptomyces venezuelae]QER98743.1 hypothetical protein DEJ43_10325 [Streptomyces venezuelae ATCC 10712]CCA55372.1 hypothetical protein SVEN_2086 [Streptomyces venezuelae ATCC 10712]